MNPIFVPETWNGRNPSLNVAELRKAIYPNYLNSNLGFYPKENKCVEKTDNLRAYYVAFYYRDDNFNVEPLKDIKDTKELEHNAIFIFRFYCDIEDYKTDDDFYYRHNLHDVFDDVRHGNENLCYMLCSDNFPISLSEHSISKSEMEEFDNSGYLPVLKRNVYKCITSTSDFKYEDEYREMENEDENFVYESNNKFVRFIVHDSGVDVELNSSKSDYPYVNYRIYNYLIPPAFIFYETSIDLLVSIFRKQFGIVLPFNINYNSINRNSGYI